MTPIQVPAAEERPKRTCHYCEQPKCRCNYRSGRRGKHSTSMWNTSRQSTAGEMRESFNKYFTESNETPCVWSISYTIIDPNYQDKKKVKP
jgi:hypothetical protein